MKEKPVQHDWAECPRGELKTMAARLRGRHRRQFLLKTAAPAAAVLGGGAIFWPLLDAHYQSSYAGIACYEVIELAQAYAAHDLSSHRLKEVDEHLAKCPPCRDKYQKMGINV